MSVWEIALLLHLGRIRLDVPLHDWVERFVGRPGVASAPLTVGAAWRAYDLHQFERRDPADRLLISTAIDLSCPPVTYDEPITQFARRYGSRFRFAVET